MQESKTPKIRVLVRKRPINKKELARAETDIVSIENGQTVVVKEHKLKVDLTPYVEEYKYTFDGAYDELASNQYVPVTGTQIYQTAVRPLVDCAFDGAKVTCFAYGQTGSGKTHTMLGDGASVRGMYLLASDDIFMGLKNRPDLQVWLSFYEIYCGKLYDLLNDKAILFARQDHRNNVNIVNLSESKVECSADLMEYISFGMTARVTSQNSTNNDSSRSHAILQICLKRKNKLHGKISFIDLAGSERAADHADQCQKQTRIDGAEINKSLLALKECIRALDQNKNHTPFRGSKLTMVLKDSFTGYCRTVMIGNISPNSSSSENTLNTLKYADRVKELKKAREQPFDLNKIDQLQKELMLPRNGMRPERPEPRPHHAKSQEDMEERQNTKALGNRMNQGGNKPKVISANPKHRVSPRPQNSPPQPYPEPNISKHRKQSVKEVISSVSNATNAIEANMSNLNYGSRPATFNNFLGANSNSNNGNGNVIVNSGTPQRPEDIQQLSEQHDQYIQLILEQEEKLIKQHESYINETIELTKEDMRLRNEADKIGSNIEDYLDSLDDLLERKLASIVHMQGRVRQIKGYLKESKRLEEQYAQMEKQLYQQQQECLLEDDEELFV